jgi:hypothetical protein
MWRIVGAALAATAVVATPVLAIETSSPPATVPAKITPLAKSKMAPKSGAKISSTKITGKIKTPRNHRATRIAAKSDNKSGGSKSGDHKSGGNKSAHQLGNKVSKVGVNDKRVVATKSPNLHPKQNWRQHAKLLPKSKGVQAAEPVATTGSVAPRSVPAPGLY